ncbi:hypothetical protein [Rhodococcus sp. NPDC049939]|uniref:hypothetical protein n=1 Tax=Rhodococcus sp. NPDC049939 TaxID=3155511 RepID=UPI0033FB2FA4
MSQTPIRRATVVAATAALVATGLTTSIGAGVASAAECVQSAQATKKSTVGRTYSYVKTVTETDAAPGTLVTYETVVSTSGGIPYLQSITDYPPAGFGAPVKATVKRRVIGGQETAEFTPVPDGSGYKVSSTGWSMNASNPVTLNMTYEVPDDLPVGTAVTSGGIKTTGTLSMDHSLKDALNVCFTVRNANPGEVVSGSLEDSGLGSSEGQLSSTGSIADILGDTITRFFENLS